jgi:hypothetical protein
MLEGVQEEGLWAVVFLVFRKRLRVVAPISWAPSHHLFLGFSPPPLFSLMNLLQSLGPKMSVRCIRPHKKGTHKERGLKLRRR